MVKSPARLAWLQGLEATGTTAAGLWPGRGDGKQGCHIPGTAHGVAVQGPGGRCPRPCRAGANSSAPLYSIDIPAELIKAGAGNVPGELCHPGEQSRASSTGTGSVQQLCVPAVGAERWPGVPEGL